MNLEPVFEGVSHIGMIIHTTTLDTEAKVKAFYGGNTWIQHSGYVLRGANSNVVPNSAIKDGGEDTHTLTVDEMPSHAHQVRREYGTGSNLSTGPPSGNYQQLAGPNAGTKTMSTEGIQSVGGGQAHNNIPNYKSVYIWERTS